MSLQVKIQAKAESVLASEAQFYGVTPTALAKAIIDKVAVGGLTRDVLQGVDVESYQDRKRGTPTTFPTHVYQGQKMSLSAVSKKTGISLLNLRNRLYRCKWTEERAFSEPVKERRK
ncbi:hypothetical protein [Rhizobium rhizogenes]|uniref:hypothetical protein n=1 Tax=Rhizobium rhizogenes TaxID=359 RepID=UPI0022C3CD26|nr:hypothetical protein [Rhizobium rhizogenes]MCZ7488204.1 hypothetical protein [Rhizobium rhizogenes]